MLVGTNLKTENQQTDDQQTDNQQTHQSGTTALTWLAGLGEQNNLVDKNLVGAGRRKGKHFLNLFPHRILLCMRTTLSF